ncbi:hypothetical protein [Moorena sp. SIO4G3]|uniref:hypothetical protein n=1 Tax=Moorena sp. SIO4G3 TaxID=2607821 RepID=UPI00142A42BA|nr:hypothetical protein [Moorena sp. SIO4G3]NEO79345.1 hypothetical protein [Moorena sp. SIO4G3]
MNSSRVGILPARPDIDNGQDAHSTHRVNCSRFPIPDSRFPIPDSRFPIPDSRFPIEHRYK